MTQIRRFNFDTCFDDPDDVPPAKAAAAKPAPAAEPPPPPGITKAEHEAAVAAARAEAFAEGCTAGAAEERGKIEQQMAQALSAIATRLESAGEEMAEGGRRAERRAVETGLAVMRALLPDLLRRNGLAEIEALLRECLGELVDEPRLVVRVADPVLDRLNERLPALTSRAAFSGRIILLAEEAMQEGDCRIEWADGGIERHAARSLAEIQSIVTRLLPPASSGDAA